ncbi:hypothetical protein PLICRDRAFT_25331 [Plicaturopsis crispa FD-325 SS-3]|nr:hypothetical protein PLICRDRAFT_25331 [Plicaturopsis crispa FD-325 SS-3]
MYSTTSARELIRLLVEQEYENKRMRKVLFHAVDQIDAANARIAAHEADSKTAFETLRVEHANRVRLEQEAARLSTELALYVEKSERAQAEIETANRIVRRVEKQRDELEVAVQKARSTARKYETTTLVANARAEGERVGFESGFRRAQEDAQRAYEQAQDDDVPTEPAGSESDIEDEGSVSSSPGHPRGDVLPANLANLPLDPQIEPVPVPPRKDSNASSMSEVRRGKMPSRGPIEEVQQRLREGSRITTPHPRSRSAAYSSNESLPDSGIDVSRRRATAPSESGSSMGYQRQRNMSAPIVIPPDGYVPNANDGLPPPHQLSPHVSPPRELQPEPSAPRQGRTLQRGGHGRQSSQESGFSTGTTTAGSISGYDIVNPAGHGLGRRRSRDLSVIPEGTDSQGASPNPTLRAMSQRSVTPVSPGYSQPQYPGGYVERPARRDSRAGSEAGSIRSRASNQRYGEEMRHPPPSEAERWRQSAENRPLYPAPPTRQPEPEAVFLSPSPPRREPTVSPRSAQRSDRSRGLTRTPSSGDGEVNIEIQPPSRPQSLSSDQPLVQQDGLLSPQHANRPLGRPQQYQTPQQPQAPQYQQPPPQQYQPPQRYQVPTQRPVIPQQYQQSQPVIPQQMHSGATPVPSPPAQLPGSGAGPSFPLGFMPTGSPLAPPQDPGERPNAPYGGGSGFAFPSPSQPAPVEPRRSLKKKKNSIKGTPFARPQSVSSDAPIPIPNPTTPRAGPSYEPAQVPPGVSYPAPPGQRGPVIPPGSPAHNRSGSLNAPAGMAPSSPRAPRGILRHSGSANSVSSNGSYSRFNAEEYHDPAYFAVDERASRGTPRVNPNNLMVPGQ